MTIEDWQQEQSMAGKKDLENADDLKDSIAHLDQVSARIARLLADLAAPKPVPAADEPDRPATGA
jgi:hypothetical protein